MSLDPTIRIIPAGPYAFGTINVGGSASITIQILNVSPTFPATVTAISVGGAPYSLSALPALPATIQPGQRISFNLNFNPTGVGTFNDSLTITAPGVSFFTGNPPPPYAISGTATAGPSVAVTPAVVSFPDTVVTKTAASIPITVTNNGGGAVTITAIALLTGTQFTLSGVPGLPLTLTNPGDHTTFNINWTPIAFGPQTDTLNVTTGANSPAVSVQGNGAQITPVAIITQNTHQLISSFFTAAFVVSHKQLDSTNSKGLLTSISSLTGLLQFNGSLWSQVGQEKALRRLYVIYENVGVASLTATISVLRPSQGPNFFDSKTQTISLGTAAADLTERSAYFDIQIAGEIIFLTISRTASGGPLSLIGFLPLFEEKGEKVEGR